MKGIGPGERGTKALPTPVRARRSAPPRGRPLPKLAEREQGGAPFKPGKDKLFLFDLEDREVSLRELSWVNHGDAAPWLTFDGFDLKV